MVIFNGLCYNVKNFLSLLNLSNLAPVMSIELPPYRPIKKRSGLAVMGAAFHALLMRELQTRFGSYRLGYLWAPLEVILQMAIMMIIFGAIMKRALPGMDYMLFLVAGFTPFL